MNAPVGFSDGILTENIRRTVELGLFIVAWYALDHACVAVGAVREGFEGEPLSELEFAFVQLEALLHGASAGIFALECHG
ncbi:MAG: hypothetical protein N3G20_03055 [Verrucomicrobiae bacterium]|nr:hypothetical protein [Verrucomicrobiae bacterium]